MHFYLSAAEAWEAMSRDCRMARYSIEIEQYIIENDKEGRNFIRLLAEKAAQNIQVRLLLDAVGSRRIRSSPEIAALRRAGGKVLFDHPLWWIQVFFPPSWFPRNHCKTLIADERVAYVGGACVAAPMEGWRDTQLRISGPLARTVHQDFVAAWSRLSNGQEIECLPPSPLEGSVEYVVQDPRSRCHPLYRMLLEQIAQAERYIYLVTPYFFPPRKLRAALYRARRRGVQVVIMLSKQTDVPLADKVWRALLSTWLRRGLKILLYQTTVLHAKYAIIDDRWATVGSANFDHFSMRLNREANFVLHDPENIAALKGHFLHDWDFCVNATMADWRNQPWHHKLVGKLGAFLYKLF